MQFQFQSSKKSFEVNDKNGKHLKTYIIDIGEVQTFKGVLKRFDEFKKYVETLEKDSYSDDLIDNMVKCEQDIVNILLDNDWEILWEECEHNVFMMLKLVQALILLVNSALDEQKNV